MFASIYTLVANPIRSLFVVAVMILFAVFSTPGAGLAATDPNAGPPDTSIEAQCPHMEILFRAEGRWLVEHQPYYEPDDPIMVSHRIQYWNYWHFLETWCGGAPVAH